MLKKTIAASGILAAAAAGVIIAGQPASAQAPAWHGCCSSSGFFHGSAHRNRNWNGNENENFNHIRLHIHNRNNNIAVARAKNDEDQEHKQELFKDNGPGQGNLTAIGAPGAGPGTIG